MPTRHFLVCAAACGPGIAQSSTATATRTAVAIRIPVLMSDAPPVGVPAWGWPAYPSCRSRGTPGTRGATLRGGASVDQMVEFIQSHQHVAGVAPLGGAHDAFLFQLIDDAGGPDIADLHLPLQQRHRAIPRTHNQPCGVGQQGVFVSAATEDEDRI